MIDLASIADVQSFFAQYGLIGLFFGAAIEGDICLILAGLLIHIGIFDFGPTSVTAIAGLLTADLLFFWLGRRSRGARWIGLHADKLLNRACGILEHYGLLALVMVRLCYGLRNATFFLCGRQRWSYSRFLAIDLVGSSIWTAVTLGLGYGFSSSIELVLGDVRIIEQWLFVCVAALVVVTVMWRQVMAVRNDPGTTLNLR